MKTYIFPQDHRYGKVFAIAKTLSGYYVCPGWHLVPDGTTRDQILFEEADHIPKKQNSPVVTQSVNKEWVVNGSKPGITYNINQSDDVWNCSCPAKSFNRGDCKHIKAKKQELSELIIKKV